MIINSNFSLCRTQVYAWRDLVAKIAQRYISEDLRILKARHLAGFIYGGWKPLLMQKKSNMPCSTFVYSSIPVIFTTAYLTVDILPKKCG